MNSNPFLNAVHAFQKGDYAEAAAHAEAAFESNPIDSFYRHAVTYLKQVAERGTHDLYATADGFIAFVRRGGNVPLYANLSAELRRIYDGQSGIRLLDIGVGDGLALLPALTDSLAYVDLVEPAAAMLASTSAALGEEGVSHSAHNVSAETFISQAREPYNIAQATFAMHNLPPAQRAPLFAWLREHSGTVLIAEFDVQMDVMAGSAEHVNYLITRYRQGLAEYEPDEEVVAQGFLMPILFRNFESIGEAAIYEQPIERWETELRAAGFTAVKRHLLHNYWWADAYLLVAN